MDGLGWEWIFFINIPVGIVGFILALRFVPSLSTHPHKFDIPGVLLSAVGLFLLVFGIQEGETYNWGTITGPITVWGLIIAGIVVLVGVRGLAAVQQGRAAAAAGAVQGPQLLARQRGHHHGRASPSPPSACR